MVFTASPEHVALPDAVERICAGFADPSWLAPDPHAPFPHELHQALAQAGFLGICIPEEYGGSGLGITEAAIMMQAIAQSGAAMSGASAVHMNIFGLNPVLRFGTPEQKARMLPPLVAGREQACFGVTEPDAGLDTTQLKTPAERRGDRYRVNAQTIWTTTAPTAPKS